MSTKAEKLKSKYLSINGNLCPVCDSNDLATSSFEVSGATTSQKIDCDQCGSSWLDVYTLTDMGKLTAGPDFLPDDLVTVNGYEGVFVVIEVVESEVVKVRSNVRPDAAVLTVFTGNLTAYTPVYVPTDGR